MRFAAIERRVPGLAWTLGALVILGAIGFIDYITGPEIALSIFYLVPIGLAAWKAGFVAGIFVAAAGGVTWFAADAYWGMPYSHPLIPYWNAFVRFGFFFIMVLYIDKIRRLTASLEQQAASLRQQIADRERAEAALAESRKVFQLITENVSDMIAVISAKGRRLYSSPSYNRLASQSIPPPAGDYMAEVIPEDREQVRRALEQTLKTGVSQRLEYRLPLGSHQVRYLESDWSVIREPDGAWRNVVVVSRDVTLRKRMEVLYANEREILERIAGGTALPLVLQKIIASIQAGGDDLFGSILVQDVEGNPVLHAGHLDVASGQSGDSAAAPVGAAGDVTAPSSSAVPYPPAHQQWVRLDEYASKRGLRVVYAKPIVSTLGESLGSITIYGHESDDPNALRLRLFETTAHLTAIALERQRSEQTLRQLSSMILNAQEAERRRLARDLHDSVSQMLSAISFRMESIIGQVPREIVAIRHELVKVRFLLKKAIHEVRSISENLRPSELDELGLLAAVRDLVEDFRERTELAVELVLPVGSERLSGDVELALYRIIQECLSNIEKHADASHVRLELKWDGTVVSLVVRDDGNGRPPATQAGGSQRQRMGLVNMKERCAFLGGTFSVRSEPRVGTEIAVTIPRQELPSNTGGREDHEREP